MANISDLLLKNKTHAKIFNHAANIGKKLNTPIYIVGGYVRDLILGKELKDIDLMVEKNSDIFAENLAKKLSINKVVKFEKFHTYRIPYDKVETRITIYKKSFFI